MKTFVRLISIAILGGAMITGIPAAADTAYHSVYEAPVTTTDSFSILDKYGNNVLTPGEYNNAANVIPFDAADINKDGFISRPEFYANRQMTEGQAYDDLNLIMPAAGGETLMHNDCIYNDERTCEVRPY
jgi:hypothetical protein